MLLYSQLYYNIVYHILYHIGCTARSCPNSGLHLQSVFDFQCFCLICVFLYSSLCYLLCLVFTCKPSLNRTRACRNVMHCSAIRVHVHVHVHVTCLRPCLGLWLCPTSCLHILHYLSLSLSSLPLCISTIYIYIYTYYVFINSTCIIYFIVSVCLHCAVCLVSRAFALAEDVLPAPPSAAENKQINKGITINT